MHGPLVGASRRCDRRERGWNETIERVMRVVLSRTRGQSRRSGREGIRNPVAMRDNHTLARGVLVIFPAKASFKILLRAEATGIAPFILARN